MPTFEALLHRMKSFEIPTFYRSPIISKVKALRKLADPRKKDFSPTVLDFGTVQIVLPRHFGFCYGVENAIEIAYKALLENPDKRIFLLSEMIHNQEVNADLLDQGVRFLMDTKGRRLVDFASLTPEDIVIVPAFGTTLEMEEELRQLNIEASKYNTTCPFVEKVWKRSTKLGGDRYTTIIHGKPDHEETRATFSHAANDGPALVVADRAEAEELAAYVRGDRDFATFSETFKGRFSLGFQPDADLSRIGVVNQTTMLASETQGIADLLKEAVMKRFPDEPLELHFADTRDTLCYATNDNQQATLALFEDPADMAIVVGGSNSSNTSHLVELCEEQMPTYFIQTDGMLESGERIKHFDLHEQNHVFSEDYLPKREIPRIVVTSGASCPDALVDRVIQRLLEFYNPERSIAEALSSLEETRESR